MPFDPSQPRDDHGMWTVGMHLQAAKDLRAQADAHGNNALGNDLRAKAAAHEAAAAKGDLVTGSGWYSSKAEFIPAQLYQHATVAKANGLAALSAKHAENDAISKGHVRILDRAKAFKGEGRETIIDTSAKGVPAAKKALNNLPYPDDHRVLVSMCDVKGNPTAQIHEGTIKSARTWLSS